MLMKIERGEQTTFTACLHTVGGRELLTGLPYPPSRISFVPLPAFHNISVELNSEVMNMKPNESV